MFLISKTSLTTRWLILYLGRIQNLERTEAKMPMDSPPPLEPDYSETLPPPISDLSGNEHNPIEDVMSSLKLSESSIGKNLLNWMIIIELQPVWFLKFSQAHLFFILRLSLVSIYWIKPNLKNTSSNFGMSTRGSYEVQRPGLYNVQDPALYKVECSNF